MNRESHHVTVRASEADAVALITLDGEPLDHVELYNIRQRTGDPVATITLQVASGHTWDGRAVVKLEPRAELAPIIFALRLMVTKSVLASLDLTLREAAALLHALTGEDV